MSISKVRLHQGIAATCVMLASLTNGFSAAQAENLDLLRTIPLAVQGYGAAQTMPDKMLTADQVMQALYSTPVLLVHMEALRRGYNNLSITEQDKLLATLLKRHQANERDLMLGFDHGYAQLVYKNNKTGLFFLRKANDHFNDQFSSLAYGMAEAEADLTLENATPEQMTTRKLDAIYKLGDSVKLDAVKHQPGFWPSYLRVVEKLKTLPAYQSFSRRDFSLAYVPYGNTVVPLNTTSTVSSLPLLANGQTPPPYLSGSVTSSCNPEAASASTSTLQTNVIAQKSASFSGTPMLIRFFATDEAHVYQAVVSGPTGNTLLTFKTNTSPNILEDLDGDGVFEIVARQYQYNPSLPVIVYRYTPCGFELDQKVKSAFE